MCKGGVIEGQRGIYSPSKMHLGKGKTKKQTGRQKTILKQGHTTCHQRYKMQQKGVTRILAKKQTKTISTHKQKTKRRSQTTKPFRKNTKEAKTAKKHASRGRQADRNLQTSRSGGNDRVCG